MAGLYEMSTLELLDANYGYQQEYEPAKFPVYWRGQPRCEYPLGVEAGMMTFMPTINEACEIISLPPSRGMTFKFQFNPKGGMYVGASVEPEEIPEREQKFREYIGPIMADPWKYWEDYKKQLNDMWEPVKEFAWDVENKKDHEISMFLNDRYWWANRQAGRIHFIVLYPLTALYVTFENMTKEMFGFDDSDPKFKKLFQGFNHRSYDVDRELWYLAQQAAQLGLRDVFVSTPNDRLREIPSMLEQTEAGKKFLGDFNKFIREEGWRSETFSDCTIPGWVDDPAMPLALLKAHAERGEFILDRTLPELAKERDELIEELSRNLPEEPKGIWMALLRAGQTFETVSEEHPLYVELPCASTLHRILKEVGKRWQRKGTIEEWSDIFYLGAGEISYHIIDYRDMDFRKIVQRRKKLWEEAKVKMEAEPTYWGDPSAVEFDPILRKVCGYGITVTQVPDALVSGVPGAPGVVEGIARVIATPKELGTLEDGTILVCEVTTPAWIPVFSKAKAVITDWGGPLSHAALVGREYKIPVVVATQNATKVIRNGQRIRVDGDKGVVYAID
jgi:pyruvate,water dikinase